MNRALKLDTVEGVPWGYEESPAPMCMHVIDASERFRLSTVSILSVTWGDSRRAYKANVLPEHRNEIAAWLRTLADRIGEAD